MKQLKGIVVSTKMDKTVLVRVSRIKKHPIYERRYRVYKKYQVHDQNNECKIGQTILIKEVAPISKKKYFQLVKILEQK